MGAQLPAIATGSEASGTFAPHFGPGSLAKAEHLQHLRIPTVELETPQMAMSIFDGSEFCFLTVGHQDDGAVSFRIKDAIDGQPG